MTATIRSANRAQDGAGVWAVLKPVLAAGETYVLPRDWSEGEALEFWFAPTREVFVAEREETLAGTYFLAANGAGGGAHVANAGFAVGEAARGRGLGEALCRHAMSRAGERGFTAMQFNHVVSSNESAVRLWRRLGFKIVGRSPKSFRLPTSEFVDQLIMHREL